MMRVPGHLVQCPLRRPESGDAPTGRMNIVRPSRWPPPSTSGAVSGAS